MVKVIGYDLAKKKFQELEDKLSGKYNKTDTVDRAYRDASGRSISGTYATKDEVRRARAGVSNLKVRHQGSDVYYSYVSWSCQNCNGITGTLYISRSGSVSSIRLSSSNLIACKYDVSESAGYKISAKIDLDTGTSTGWVLETRN